ncbi:hypothetical protein O6H91_02G060900 [Diphasiastrum complanatum]|uniref:Uncharacterized protein n=1 Tax=Diphasiastrum complanatum TaxID=34168 RepID=A0ACC2EFW5_DIPCM|nr:hypothetical protein O6H91_02G060900 [Diphasiastrum complanatum]
MGICISAASSGNEHDEEGKPHGVKERAKQRLVKPGHNKGVVPLGKRTNFGYARNFKDKYELGKLLGHGQFGYTYEAMEIFTGANVAVKRIEKKKMLLPISIEDVRREVKILQALSGHENIVQFYAAFEDDDYVYIAMELLPVLQLSISRCYLFHLQSPAVTARTLPPCSLSLNSNQRLCEGGELLDCILAKKDGRYSEKDAAKLVRQMLNVVARCHLNGIVHRDLKPENFLFKSRGEDSSLKATDFGLSDYIRPGKRFRDVVGSAYYVAPEVLRRKSGPESDVWSIGVITYILLCGRRPFWDKTEAGIFNEVLKKKPDFRAKPWPSISSSAKDFVRKLLAKDPHTRLTASQALSHPWVREGGNASEIPLDISVLSNMREFVKYSRLKQLAFRALASTLDSGELANLRDQFDAIDIDKSGTITFEEIRQALAKDQPWAVKESRALEILQAMDNNRDGFVDFDEFVAATLHVRQLEELDTEKWQQRSKAAFDQFDFDKDGYISAEELRQYTGVKGSIESLLEEADVDGDGKISLTEFQKLLHQASLGSRTNGSASNPSHK